MSFHVAYNLHNRKKYQHFMRLYVSACFLKNNRSMLLITVWLRVRVLPGAPMKSTIHATYRAQKRPIHHSGQPATLFDYHIFVSTRIVIVKIMLFLLTC